MKRSTDTRHPVIDVRPREAFLAAHDPQAISLPLEQLAERTHELPRSRSARLWVYDADPKRRRAAREALQERGFSGVRELADRTRDEAWVTGPARLRLWRPNPFLVRMMPRIQEALPESGDALDLACGAGRDAVYLAEQGFRVRAVDHLPSALERAAALASENGVQVEVVQQDLEAPEVDLGREQYDLITGFHFLWRPLFPAVTAALRPGGLLCYRTFDRRERDRTGHPRSDKHVLEPGELEELCSRSLLERLHYEAGPDEHGRILQGLLARKPAS